MYCYISAILISDILTSQSGPPAAGAPRMGCRGRPRPRRQMPFHVSISPNRTQTHLRLLQDQACTATSALP